MGARHRNRKRLLDLHKLGQESWAGWRTRVAYSPGLPELERRCWLPNVNLTLKQLARLADR